jgi:uncharacterized protein (TIGR02145 family)
MKRIKSIVSVLFFGTVLWAQPPEKMSYQAVIRNSSDELVVNHAVGVRISILQGGPSGAAVYQELFNPNPQTNSFGLVSVEVGTGVPISGTFSGINWESGTYFIKVETDPTGGTDYSISGISQLLSVPYAFHAKTAERITSVPDPKNDQDAANKAYVDKLENQIQALENKLIDGELLVKDIDGNIYNSIRIGSQVWMAENLKTTRYNDGGPIPLVTDNATWMGLNTPGRCYYNNDSATYKNTYGALYNWFTVNTGKLCPAGWRVPGADDFTTLSGFLGGDSVAGGKLKEAGTIHWLLYPNFAATNESGFTALPAGYRHWDGGLFYNINYSGQWWTSTEHQANAISRGIAHEYESFGWNYYEKQIGFSVRCLKE